MQNLYFSKFFVSIADSLNYWESDDMSLINAPSTDAKYVVGDTQPDRHVVSEQNNWQRTKKCSLRYTSVNSSMSKSNVANLDIEKIFTQETWKPRL